MEHSRLLKFRAWIPSIKQMLTVDIEQGRAKFGHTLFEDDVVMQYTGLKDKNGREIYDGDILREEYRIERVDGSMPDNTNRTIGVVSFKVHEDDDYEGFYAHGWFVGDYSLTPRFVSGSYDNPYWKIKDDDTSGFEVIGNLYENPELLK